MWDHFGSLAHLPGSSSVRMSSKAKLSTTTDYAQSVQISRYSHAAMSVSLAECGFQSLPPLLPLIVPMLDMGEFCGAYTRHDA